MTKPRKRPKPATTADMVRETFGDLHTKPLPHCWGCASPDIAGATHSFGTVEHPTPRKPTKPEPFDLAKARRKVARKIHFDNSVFFNNALRWVLDEVLKVQK